MLYFVGFVVLSYLIWRVFYKPKKVVIDRNSVKKDHKYYMREFPELFPEKETQIENTQITIINNHLHLHFKEGENRFRQSFAQQSKTRYSQHP